MDTLCKIRDMYRAIAEFEARFEKVYQLGLNEGMVLCCLSRMEKLSSGEIAEQLNLTNSNTSKVIKSMESKGFIRRTIGDNDKRQMNFSLTSEGEMKVREIEGGSIEIPELLKKLL